MSKATVIDLSEDDAEMAPEATGSSISGNVMLKLLSSLEFVLGTLCANCLICHRLLDHPGFKPTVCERDSCVTEHEQLGVGVNLAAEIVNSPEVVDLLISFW